MVRKRNLIIVAAVALLGVAAWVGNGYVRQKEQFASGALDVSALAQRHRGPGPCTRWDFETKPTDAEVETVAQELHALHLDSHAVSQTFGVVHKWSLDREARAHELSAGDELADALSGTLGGRLYVALNRERIEQIVAIDASRVYESSKPAFDALPAPTQKRLQELAEAHPLPLSLKGIIPLVHRLRVLDTEATFDAMAARLEQARAQTGQYPESLDAVYSGDTKAIEDAWEQPIRLVNDAKGLRLVSYGGDGAEGGEGQDADLERVLQPPPSAEAEQVAAPVPQPAPCRALPATVELPEKDFLAATSGSHGLTDDGMDARIVPAFVDGQVVGFRLFAVKPGSIYERAGLCNRDIVKQVNTIALTTPDAFEKLSSLKNARRFDLAVDRAGRDGTLTVLVK